MAGMRKGVDGQLVKTASRGRGAGDGGHFALAGSGVGETAHSVKAGGDQSGSGMMHLKQASHITSSFMPQTHAPSESGARRGYSMHVPGGSTAASPERRHAGGAPDGRHELTQSQIERKEMESIQLFAAQ